MPTYLLCQYGKIGNESKDITIPHGAFGYIGYDECVHEMCIRDSAGIVKWPMSVIRLQGEITESIVKAADHIVMLWRRYTDEKAFIFSETNGVPHNTITPIARKKGNLLDVYKRQGGYRPEPFSPLE